MYIFYCIYQPLTDSNGGFFDLVGGCLAPSHSPHHDVCPPAHHLFLTTTHALKITYTSAMVRPRKPPSSELFACLFCDLVFPSRGGLNVHLDRTLPAYRIAFGHPMCPPDRLHHQGIIQSHRLAVRRPNIDIEEADPILRLVLAEFARYTEYATVAKKLPPRTSLCEVDALWWQAAVDEVLESFKDDADRGRLRSNVMALVNTSKFLVQNDITTGNKAAVNTGQSGGCSGNITMKGAGDLAIAGRSVVNDNRRSAFADRSKIVSGYTRKRNEPAAENEDGDYQPEDEAGGGSGSAGDRIIDHLDLTETDSESESESSESESDVEPQIRSRRARKASPDELALPVRPRPSVVIPKSVAPRPKPVAPEPVIPRPKPVVARAEPVAPHPEPVASKPAPEAVDALFTLQVSILRRPAICVPVYGHETLAGIIETAWRKAPKVVRRMADAKVMFSEETGWCGVWTELLWSHLVAAAGNEVEPPVYCVVLEFAE